MTFLDTNVLLRYLTWDDPERAQKCERLFKRVTEGREILYTTTLVIAEVVWTLEKAYKLSRREIATYVQAILNTRNIELDEKDIVLAAISLYALKGIDFIDAYNAISMEVKGIDSIYSYDSHFDLLPSLKRLEP